MWLIEYGRAEQILQIHRHMQLHCRADNRSLARAACQPMLIDPTGWPRSVET